MWCGLCLLTSMLLHLCRPADLTCWQGIHALDCILPGCLLLLRGLTPHSQLLLAILGQRLACIFVMSGVKRGNTTSTYGSGRRFACMPDSD